MTSYISCLIAVILLLCNVSTPLAATPAQIERPPLSENWFGIYLDNERVGFYRQRISEGADGYRMDGDGSIYLRVMGFSKEASTRETYQVTKNLVLRSFDVEQTINGSTSRTTGTVAGGNIRIKHEDKGKSSDKLVRYKGEVYPGPALNLYPLLHDSTTGKSYKILTFDPEELKVKEVKISVVGREKTPDGVEAIKLSNNLYPFVSNDIWVDNQGSTLYESVRNGLVITKAEKTKELAVFVGEHALSKKDLIYDFSLVRAEPPIKNIAKLTGLSLEISGWNDDLPLLQGGGQLAQKLSAGKIIFKTGTLVEPDGVPAAAEPVTAYLQPADKIESNNALIMTQVRLLATDTKGPEELVKKIAAWTAEWLSDSVDDGGGAAASYVSKRGNCQTHARLYSALARAAGIPTRFVSGLVYQEGKGFLYHSWAESFLAGRWVAVDPTYNQFPADPTHLKLLEGHLPEDLAPIITIIGRVKIQVLEKRY
ncbi:MAG TPA: transglutaminase domain-containing protein [Desulfuromonadales bacterium]|nr:transglutaminase domain-containing protein [Desulfuromonadales bacterium]